MLLVARGADEKGKREKEGEKRRREHEEKKGQEKEDQRPNTEHRWKRSRLLRGNAG